MHKPQIKPIAGTKLGLTGETEYISECLHQAVPVGSENTKRIRLTGARVLTNDEAMQIVQEKENKINKKQLEKGKRKVERERVIKKGGQK